MVADTDTPGQVHQVLKRRGAIGRIGPVLLDRVLVGLRADQQPHRASRARVETVDALCHQVGVPVEVHGRAGNIGLREAVVEEAAAAVEDLYSWSADLEQQLLLDSLRYRIAPRPLLLCRLHDKAAAPVFAVLSFVGCFQYLVYGSNNVVDDEMRF